MGQQFEELSDQHKRFIAEQRMFFVGSAAEHGKVNVSPKGGDSLRVLSSRQIAWLNLTGSGNETAAHVLRDARMTLMWCAFEGAPLILRCYGKAQVVHRGDQPWQQLSALFPAYTGARQIFVVDIDLVQSSCGMSVPYFDFVADRDALNNWADQQGEQGIANYWLKKNQKSLDDFDTEIAQRSGLS